MGANPERSWTEYDDGLLYTLWIVSSLLTGRGERLECLNPPFAIDYHQGERVFTAAPFQVLAWASPGDGTYLHDSSFLFATGRGGLTVTAAAAAFRAAGNARRRGQAERDAMPRWMPVDQGTVWVSSHGFRIGTMRGLTTWPWSSVDGMQMVNQGDVQIQAQSVDGPINCQIVSPAAELIFALWVLALQVPHPQWMDRGWIPAHWLSWAAAQGKQMPFNDPTEIGL